MSSVPPSKQPATCPACHADYAQKDSMEAHLLRSQDADHVAHRKRNQAPSIIAMFEKQKRPLTESMEAAAPGGDPARQRTDAASVQLMDRNWETAVRCAFTFRC